jgi:predicted nucleotidyltransferase component of viral defense system
MINRASIIGWRTQVPWDTNEQVEQDLILCRALIAIYSDDFLSSQLAFRGGTALHKLYLSPQARYSEDIDLVQINPGPIKPILYRLGEVLDFLPNRTTKQKRYNNIMLFRMESEIPPIVQIRIKIEINCYEHFTELGYVKMPFAVINSWFSGKCETTTYSINELLGSKLRALYQRKKGRDLFDLYEALVRGEVNTDEIVRCYKRYMAFVVNQQPTYKQFVINMEEKLTNPIFLEDTQNLVRPDKSYNPKDAYDLVKKELIDRLM